MSCLACGHWPGDSQTSGNIRQKQFFPEVPGLHIEMTKKLLNDRGGSVNCYCLSVLHFYQHTPRIVVNKSHFVHFIGFVMPQLGYAYSG